MKWYLKYRLDENKENRRMLLLPNLVMLQKLFICKTKSHERYFIVLIICLIISHKKMLWKIDNDNIMNEFENIIY